MASTASKSPGEVIGKPASITSTPRRASCCAISSFSAVLSEMPGDCSPSRSVVSKISTRCGSALSMGPAPFPSSFFSGLCLRLRGRHALFPPRGEEKKAKGEQMRHRLRRLPSRPVSEQPSTAAWRLVDAHQGFETLFSRAATGGHLVEGYSAGVEDGRAWGVRYEI